MDLAEYAARIRHGDNQRLWLVCREFFSQGIEAGVDALLVLVEHFRCLNFGAVVLRDLAHELLIDTLPLIAGTVQERGVRYGESKA
jgi:hypothetical protein